MLEYSADREPTRREQLRRRIQDHFTAVADGRDRAAEGDARPHLRLSFGDDLPAVQFYSDQERMRLPHGAIAASIGCGNPLSMAQVLEGETVLDVGCGAGIDCLLASERVGPEGRVFGIEMTSAMVDLARANADQMDCGNVVFMLRPMETMPFPDASVDVVISNWAISFSPEKDLVFQDAYRVLSPGGRVYVSDMVSMEALSEDVRNDLNAWALGAGAEPRDHYLERLESAGFTGIEILHLASTAPFVPKHTWQESLVSITVAARKPAEES